MQRRQFFQSVINTAATLALPTSLLGMSSSSYAQSSHVLLNKAALFKSNPQLTPLRGYQGQDVRCDQAWIEGKIPADLRGNFYRNGPGLFERGGQRYQHWFDGDGLVHAWRFTDQGVSHQAKFVRTKKLIAESAANEFLVPAFGTAIPAKIPVRSSDSMNTANTNVIELNGQLLAMWEGGSAHSLHPESLATQGVVSWSDELKGMPFSAHPKVEADGTVWNFGTMSGKMVIYHISKQGKLLRHAVFDMPASAMVHDFSVSQEHLIFLLPPISTNLDAMRSGKSLAESMEWKPEQGTKVLVVKKSDFSKRSLFELPAMMVFHFGNAWEKDQVIHVDFVKSDDLDTFNSQMPKMMRGEDIAPNASVPTVLSIDLKNKKLSMNTFSARAEFPRIDPRFVAQKNRYVYYPCGELIDQKDRFSGLMRLDIETGKITRFDMGAQYSLEEHVFVPKPNSSKEGQGYLVGVGFDVERQTSFSSVFDAENLAAGPMALAYLPYWLPFCFHGNFYART
jgi:all-trans-8'-apo-beta-carotenal 15,15'-oxygenase